MQPPGSADLDALDWESQQIGQAEVDTDFHPDVECYLVLGDHLVLVPDLCYCRRTVMVDRHRIPCRHTRRWCGVPWWLLTHCVARSSATSQWRAVSVGISPNFAQAQAKNARYPIVVPRMTTVVLSDSTSSFRRTLPLTIKIK